VVRQLENFAGPPRGFVKNPDNSALGMANASGAGTRRKEDDGRSNDGAEAPRKKTRVSLQGLINDLTALGASITTRATVSELADLLF